MCYCEGSNIARKWVVQGCKDIDDLKAAVTAGQLKLTHVQEVRLYTLSSSAIFIHSEDWFTSL